MSKSAPPPESPSSSPRSKFSVAGGVRSSHGERIGVFGEGGIGKSSLCSLAPDPLFFDLENGTQKLNVQRVGGITELSDLREALRDQALWKNFRTGVIDSGTALQELLVQHVIKTVKHKKGKTITSIEDFDWGSGFQHVYDAFLLLLGDFDQIVRNGRNIILICHLAVERAPNPDGDDFLRYEPALQNPPKQGRIRDRFRDWCDHLLFVQYDKKVTDGKAVGQGTRTIYPTARPTYWAKSRSLREPIVFEDPATDPEGAAAVWKQLGLK